MEQESEEISAHIKEEETQVDELKDRLLRMAAEFDNYKKRTAKEVESSKGIGKAEIVKKLLPVLDEFELALGAIKNENGSQLKGIELVYANMLDVLKAEGLAQIETDGTADPFKHEVMLARESEEKEGTVLEVVRKGYTFKEMLIRPASVIVSKGREEKEKGE